MSEPSSNTSQLLPAAVVVGAIVAFLMAAFAVVNQGPQQTTDRDVIAETPAAGSDLTALDGGERDALRAEVRAYLLENPEVIMEAVAILEERQQQDAARADVDLVRAHAPAIFEDGYSHISGNPEGDITIVEFIDYRCGFCRRAHGDVQELISSDGNIRLITKEFPILGPNSVASSEFAIAVKQVAGPEAYAAASAILIELNAEMGEPALRRLAGTLAVDADAVIAAMKSEAVQMEIMATRALAQRLNINGTPTFVVGTADGETEMLRGYLPLDGMREVVDTLRDAG